MRKLDSEQVLVTVLMLFKASTESFVISVYVSFSCQILFKQQKSRKVVLNLFVNVS